MNASAPLLLRTLGQLTVEDEAAFRPVALYARLRDSLIESGYTFRILSSAEAAWDRALFLNLTFWDPRGGGDVLMSESIPADVVAHVAWHHLATRAISGAGADTMTSDALFLGESIASAFDLYLVGRLLLRKGGSSFLDSQVSLMSEAALAAGLPEKAFAALLESIARDPEAAFEELRALLFDATTALVRCPDLAGAATVMESFSKHRFAPLLHHYQLSNWVLFALAHAVPGPAHDARVRSIDSALRTAPDSLAWLEEHWLG